MAIAWYDRDLQTVPAAEIETPFGVMMIVPSSPEQGYSVNCEMKEPVLINRVLYILQGNYHLDTQREEWYGGLYPRRCRRVEPTTYNPKTWELPRNTDTSPTKNALKASRRIDPVFKQWAENNFAALIRGRNVEMQNLIQRGHNRLDKAIADIEARRAELTRMQNDLDKTGSLAQEDMSLLSDIFGFRWKF